MCVYYCQNYYQIQYILDSFSLSFRALKKIKIDFTKSVRTVICDIVDHRYIILVSHVILHITIFTLNDR